MFSKLNLPEYEMKVRVENSQKQVFDPVRKKYVALTPEEYVRQHVINYLINHKGFPSGLLSVEQLVTLNTMQQRADIIAYKKNGNPLLVVECKSFSVEITKKSFEQAARYNLTLKAPYLVVSNGLAHYCFKINLEEETFVLLGEFPDYQSIS